MICEVECCDSGVIYQGSCHCDIGSFGDECQSNLEHLYKVAYYSFEGLFLLAFVFILLITTRQFVQQLKMLKLPSYYSWYESLVAIYGSPQNSILILTIILSACKLIWLILDPLEIYRGKTLVIERLLAEIVYTLLFFIYGCLLIVWYTMYDEISFNVYEGKNRKWIFRYYKEIMKGRLIAVIVIQITVSTLNGLRLSFEYQPFLMTCYVFLIINFFFFIIEFLIYGSSLQKCIQDQMNVCKTEYSKKYQEKKEIKQQYEDSLMSRSPESAAQRPKKMSRQISIEDHKQEFVDEVKQIDIAKPKIAVSKIKSVSFARTFIKGARGSSLFRQESQKQLKSSVHPSVVKSSNTEASQKDLEQFEQQPIEQEQQNSCCLNQDHPLDWKGVDDKDVVQDIVKSQIKTIKESKDAWSRLEHTRNRPRRETTKQPYKVSSSSSLEARTYIQHQHSDDFQEKYTTKTTNLAIDRQILFKIQLLVYFGIILEVLFGCMSIVVLTTDYIRNPVGAIVYLYVSSTLQFFSLITVLRLFKDVKSQEVKNLIWIQKIGSKNNKINQHYLFTIPEKQDEQKRKFEQRINMITLY